MLLILGLATRMFAETSGGSVTSPCHVTFDYGMTKHVARHFSTPPPPLCFRVL